MQHQSLVRICAARGKHGAILLTTLSMLLLALHASSARGNEAVDQTFPVSITSSGIFAAQSTGERPSISDDGRHVAFESATENLGEDGPPGVDEAFVKDLQTGEVTLVSRASGAAGEPANEPGEGSGVEDLSISGDGRFVIFTSDASNLVTGLPAAEEPGEHPLHVYRRDLQTGETELVDRVSGSEGEILDERGARAEGISAEGRYVLFRDRVEDLEDPVGAHEAGLSTVYVRDMQSSLTSAVSRAGGAQGALADESSRGDSISADGRYVTYESAATNLVAGMEGNAVSQVYLRDLQSEITTLVSRSAPTESAPTGEPGNGASEAGVPTDDDGCNVAFSSAASNLYRFAGGPVSTPEVYLADLCSTPVTIRLVSRADGAEGAPAAEGNVVIPLPLGAGGNGRLILFSALSELTGESSAASTHLYIRNLDTEQTTLIDRASGAGGAPADSNPEGGAIAANACRVAFATEASNLGEVEAPRERSETYIRQLAPCLESAEGSAGGSETASARQITQTAIAETTVASRGTARCVVPTMRGLRLRAVRKRLGAAHCRLGRVSYHYSRTPKGRLTEQSLHQGTIRPAGAKLSIWISRGGHSRRLSRQGRRVARGVPAPAR
jgi:Tol biopolymer transport system component